MNFVDELKHEHLKDAEDNDQIDSGKTSGDNGGSGEINDNQSALALFDKLNV